MSEWKPIETAPKGYYEKGKTRYGERDIFKKQWVETRRKDGHQTPSYWSVETNAWAGYTKAAGPDEWRELNETVSA